MFKNVLDIPWVGTLIRSTWTWRFARLAMFALLLLMIALGWHQHAIPGVAVRDPLMYTNFTTFNLWVLWLMGMVGVVLFFGRFWCTICPVGWLNGIFSRFGLRREIPEWLNNFVAVTLVLVVLQLLVYFLAIHRFPDYSSVFLAWMLVFAFAAGLVFRRRAFCLLLCPAGAVFNLYARMAPWQLRVKSRHVCDGCEDKPCIATDRVWQQAAIGDLRLAWRSRPEGCPVALVPADIKDSADCTLCLNCAQTCCNDNIVLGTRGWPGDLRQEGLRPSVTLFFLVLLGLLTANFSKVYVDLREAIFWVPESLALALGWDTVGFYPLAVVWIGLLFPLLIFVPGLIVYLLGQVKFSTLDGPPDKASSPSGESSASAKLISTLGQMALPLLPLILSAHLVLALVKLNAKMGYLQLTLQDPSGVKSFLAINVMQTMASPGALVPLDLIKWVVVGLLVAGLLLSIWAAKTLAMERGAGSTTMDRPFLASVVVTLAVLFGFYGATVIEWLFVR